MTDVEDLPISFRKFKRRIKEHLRLIHALPDDSGVTVSSCMRIAFEPLTGGKPRELDADDVVDGDPEDPPQPGRYTAVFLDPVTKEELGHCVSDYEPADASRPLSGGEAVMRERANANAFENLSSQLSREHARTLEMEQRYDQARKDLIAQEELIRTLRGQVEDLEREIERMEDESSVIGEALAPLVPGIIEVLRKAGVNVPAFFSQIPPTAQHTQIPPVATPEAS